MTKKDYELFAYAIYEQNKLGGSFEHISAMVSLCSRVFKQDNPLFNPDKFERACYEGKHIRKSIKGGI